MSRGGRIVVARALVLIVFVGGLQWLCDRGSISRLVLVSPTDMAAKLVEQLTSGAMTDSIVQTFSTVGLAFVLAVTGGLIIGATIHALPRLRQAVDPILASYYAIPVFVFYPLLIALFGLNSIPLVVIGLLFATPAMVISTLSGLDRVPRVLGKTARIYRMSRVRSVALITLPAAAPYLFGGLKLALSYAFIGVIAGEFILSGAGLGFSIAYAYNNFDSETMYATMLFVLLVAAAVNIVLHVLEQRMLRRRARS